MNIEEKRPGYCHRKAGKVLGHFHACGSDRGTPGNDHIDWKPIAAALKGIGYQGDVVIESFTTDVKVIARAAAIWRRIERPATKSPLKASNSCAPSFRGRANRQGCQRTKAKPSKSRKKTTAKKRRR